MNSAIESTATTEGGTLTEVIELPPVELGPADTVIAGLKSRLEGVKASSPAGYQLVRTGIAECRRYRTDVEGSRKDFKRSALEWGRKVDAEARRVTDLLLEIETPLKEEKARVDDAKERIRQEKAEEILLAREAKERADREARDKEEAVKREQLRQEMDKERKRLKVQRAELDNLLTEQLTRDKAEQEKLATERRQLEQDRQNLEREKQKTAVESRKKQEAEQATLHAIEEAKEQKAREAEQKRLAEERKPDADKLKCLAVQLRSIKYPEMKTHWGQEMVISAQEEINDRAVWIDAIVAQVED